MAKKKRSHMKIAQLSEASGLGRSTIHNYLRMDLLPPPIKVGLNLHLYDETHLERLREIRYLRQIKGLSLVQIKASLSERSFQEGFAANDKSFTETSALRGPEDSSAHKGHQIINKAIYLFSEYGYENVKVSDITESLHMGKGTFYLYFKNKQELLLECFRMLRSMIQPLEQKKQIVSQKDFYLKMRDRWVGFQNSYSSFPGILNLLRTAANSADPNIREKAKEAYDSVIQPLRDDIRAAVGQGKVRDVDPELTAYVLWGIAEVMAFRIGLDDNYSTEECADFLLELVNRLLRPTEKPNTEGSLNSSSGHDAIAVESIGGLSGAVTDRQGVVTNLTGIRIGDGDGLAARIGDAAISIRLERVASVSVKAEKSLWFAEVTAEDGTRLSVCVDGDMILTGNTPLGTFRIPVQDVANIAFSHGIGKPVPSV